MTADVAEALAVARYLAASGVSVFVARPAGGRTWDPTGGTGGCGYWLPRGWQHTEADPAVIDRWMPGYGLAAVMGHVVAGVDVDPRHGGMESLAGLPTPTVYGVASTPSDGWHGLIRTLGVGSRDAVRPGIDVKDGRRDGGGRGFLWISPTVKVSKVTGEIRPYRWVRPPDFTGIEGDTSGEALADVIRALRTPPATPRPARTPLPAVTGDARTRAYLKAAVHGEISRVLNAEPGTRNASLVRAAYSLGQLAAEGLVPADDVEAALITAAAHVGLPEREATATVKSGMTAGLSTPRSTTP